MANISLFRQNKASEDLAFHLNDCRYLVRNFLGLVIKSIGHDPLQLPGVMCSDWEHMEDCYHCRDEANHGERKVRDRRLKLALSLAANTSPN